MVFSDYHVHTRFSPDAEDRMEDMVKRGIELGLREMAFTDHVDFDSPGGEFITMRNYRECYPLFRELKEKYARQITLLLGIENGYQEHVTAEMKTIIEETPLDFVLLSVHAVDHKRCCCPSYQRGVTEQTAIFRYLDTVLKAVSEFRNFDSLAHLTFLARYVKSKNLSYRLYAEYFDEIFSLLIAGNNALEVNTSGYRYGLNAPIPHWQLLHQYYKAGGRLITLGSDAHRKADLALNFQQVQQGLETIGFRYLATFRKRKMVLQPINGRPNKSIVGLSKQVLT